jgi:1-pyrroline-5-carboxylate dehydrogenase
MQILLKRSTLYFSSLPKWATVDPFVLSGEKPHTMYNILDGKVLPAAKTAPILDPLNGGNFIYSPLPEKAELDAFIASQKKIPAYGLHNPIRNVNRYMQFGEIFLKIA